MAMDVAAPRRMLCPDHGGLVDLSLPLRIGMSAPVVPEGPVGVDGVIAGDRPVAEVIAELGRMVAEGRARALAAAADSASCAICGDAYPESHLLATAGQPSVPVCPAAFDGDLFSASDDASEYLAYQIDRLTLEDLAVRLAGQGRAPCWPARREMASRPAETSGGALCLACGASF